MITERAKEFVDRFSTIDDAIIAVDQIILNCYEDMEEYWQELKEEIQKL